MNNAIFKDLETITINKYSDQIEVNRGDFTNKHFSWLNQLKRDNRRGYVSNQTGLFEPCEIFDNIHLALLSLWFLASTSSGKNGKCRLNEDNTKWTQTRAPKATAEHIECTPGCSASFVDESVHQIERGADTCKKKECHRFSFLLEATCS